MFLAGSLTGNLAGNLAGNPAGNLDDWANTSDLRLTPFLEAGRLWGSSEVTTSCQE